MPLRPAGALADSSVFAEEVTGAECWMIVLLTMNLKEGGCSPEADDVSEMSAWRILLIIVSFQLGVEPWE